MHTVEVNSHLRIPVDAVDLGRVIKDLTLYNSSVARSVAMGFGIRKGVEETTLLYAMDDEHVVVPRGYEPPYHNDDDIEYADFRPEREQTWNLEFRKELWEDQEDSWTALLALEGRDGLLCLGCGRGKSEIALKYAGERGLPTLIVVDQIAIADQWLQRICGTEKDPNDSDNADWVPFENRCYDIKESEVGWIQANTFKIGDQFTIAIIHTLSQRIEDLPPALWDHFGLIILDEVHVMAAPTFAEVVPLFSGQRLALTATFERKDKMEAVYMQHCGGDTPCHIDTRSLRSKKWYFKKLPALLSPEEDDRCYKWAKSNGRANDDNSWGAFKFLVPWKYQRFVTKHEGFFNLICKDLLQACRAGRHCMLLGDRIEHLERIAEFVRSHGFTAECVNAQTKRKARRAAFQDSQVILATLSLAGKALDIKRLDTLFFLTPFDNSGTLRQASNRIGRDLKSDKDPIVVVYQHATRSLARKAMEMRVHVMDNDMGAEIFDVEVEF